MSLVATWVRAKDGAWYKNPVLIFAEGYICFDDEEPPELVLWLNQDGLYPDPAAVLHAQVGGTLYPLTETPKKSQRTIPGSEPQVFADAAAFFFNPKRRIPVPDLHDGCERRLSRVGAHCSYDLPANPDDAYEL